MSRHTPRPWYVEPPTAQSPSTAAVTACCGFVRIYEAPLTRETAANARLIAAAPDLLAACKALMAVAPDNSYHDQKCAQLMGEAGWTESSNEAWDEFAQRVAREAIARAEGEAS